MFILPRPFSRLRPAFWLCAAFACLLIPQNAVSALPTRPPAPAKTGPKFVPSAPPPLAWKTFTSFEGQFSVALPGAPGVSARSRAVGGRTLTQHTVALRRGNFAWAVQYEDLDPAILKAAGPERALQTVTQGIASRARRSRQRLLTLDGVPGREVVVTRRDGRTESTRVFLASSRLYRLTALRPPLAAVPEAGEADRFFDSFQIIHIDHARPKPPLPKP